MGFGQACRRYQSRRDPAGALRLRLRDLAESRVRYGYRPLQGCLNASWFLSMADASMNGGSIPMIIGRIRRRETSPPSAFAAQLDPARKVSQRLDQGRDEVGADMHGT